jgi:hypothetical protein
VKFLCPKCERLVELRDFKLEGAALVLTCPACGNASRVSAPSSAPSPLTPIAPTSTGERPALQLTSFPGASNVVALRSPGSDAVNAAADAARSGPFEVPAGRCPKCIAPRQAGVPACNQCGLTFAQFDSNQVAPSPWLRAAWVALLSDWGREEHHAELRHRALAEGDLASVGRLYRLRLVASAEDPFAQRGRDEVLRMALVPSTATKPSPLTEKLDPKWKYIGVGVILLFCLGLLALMARAMLSPE